jgi:hypothetical protein
MDFLGGDYGLQYSDIRPICWRKPRKTSVKADCAKTKIRTDYFPNTKEEHYCFTKLFDAPWHQKSRMV